MSRTVKSKKAPGYEYWSRRFPAPLTPGKFSKRLTHRKERNVNKKVIRAERDETMKRALMLEGALEADRYWGDLVELRLRGADVRL